MNLREQVKYACALITIHVPRIFAAFFAALLLTASASAASPACPNGILPTGNGGNLVITAGTCMVNAGTYLYQNVNIIAGGTLQFTDAKIDFWAESILVENGGSLIAGTTTAPIGTDSGQVTIHLWGRDQGTSGSAQGIPCVTPVKQGVVGPCGIPWSIWSSNVASQLDPTSCSQTTLSNGVTDCFYQYMPLDYDGGGTTPGYFGYKVLAVSYGGTLQLFGKKGATYAPLPASSSGKSWARLNGTVNTNATSLVLDRKVNWQAGDQIVLTTTDYLPGHSEVLDISSIGPDQRTITFTRDSSNLTCDVSGYSSGACYIHNGQTYNLSSVPAGIGPDQDTSQTCYSSTGTETRCVETRAAVGLLTRSIQIVSGGDTLQSNFPSSDGCQTGNPPVCNSGSCYFFGAHTIVRQGFKSYQVRGVEFYQLGQGGRIMHYPVHFHMARLTPPNTFVEDSSVWDSMTRMYTIHATQGVTLARNVGFLSIGHGYYLEDGTETGNALYGNLAVFARAAVVNDQNPRCVPGIFAATHETGTDQVPASTDTDHPTPFWIMNGWNDFQYNMAAGAGTCGMCYWVTPGGNSGNSRYEYWTSYASEQLVTQPVGGDNYQRAGLTPLKSFIGNSCVASQNAFFTIGPSAPCFGVVSNNGANAPILPSVPNSLSPDPSSQAADNYYPKISQGSGRTPTECPPNQDCTCSAPGICSSGLPGVPPCAAGQEQYCMVTAIDHFTTSFNWADTGFAAMWLRPQWYLVSNSAITDVQNGGLTMVSGGGYSNSDQIPGYWALAHKDVFVGTTQPNNYFAFNAGPFNPNSGLTCDQSNGMPYPNYCLNAKEGIVMQLENFAANQRFFNIYDGPSFQDSNAFLDINTTTLAGCMQNMQGTGGTACQQLGWMYGDVPGVPLDPLQPVGSQAYLPNAAIAWKQPNGFFYPPAFHSRNLFFNNVDIQHFVIEPLFNPNSYDTNGTLAATRYFNSSGGQYGMFNGFTDIDRQTELSDDDGTLTGLLGAPIPQTALHRPAISVNKDPFFSAPVQTVECASDILDNMPVPWGTCNQPEPLCGTANTSPYDYVTTVVYPETTDGGGSCAPQPNWAVNCLNEFCYGVPLYRQDLVPSDNGSAPYIRMAGQTDCQRSTLTVNNGTYYMDTGSSLTTQNAWDFTPVNTNVFTGGYTYYVFLLFGKATTVQTYQLYVGTDFDPTNLDQLWVTRVDKGPTPFSFYKDTNDLIVPCSARKPGSDFPWCYDFDGGSGILSITMNMGFQKFAQEYGQAIAQSCQPSTYCTWNGNSCGCALNSNDPGYNECQNACSKWAGKAIDCPWDSSDFSSGRGACYGFGFTLPSDFAANDQAPPAAQCLTQNPTWNVPLTALQSGAGACAYSPNMLPTGSFCAGGKKR